MRGFLLDAVVDEVADELPQRLSIAERGGVDQHVEFLAAIPVFESEIRRLRSSSLDALYEWWEQSGVRFWDPSRPEPTGAAEL